MRKLQVVLAFHIVTAVSRADSIFHSKTASGDLTRPTVDNTSIPQTNNCEATGSPPVAFTSQAPQFCLGVSGTQNDRCCTPSHDVYIKEHVEGLWPAECA